VSFQVVGEERPEQLTYSFIVVKNIKESCVLGLDALYKHKFMFDGRERFIYRVREPDHLPSNPICVTQRKLQISTRGELRRRTTAKYGEVRKLPQGIHVKTIDYPRKQLTDYLKFI
jgi:hypothetical protein